MSDIKLSRELNAYEGEKELTKLAIISEQEKMKTLLHGSMGEDMMAVLNGERKIEFSNYKKRKFQLFSWIKRFLRKF